jgi:hypothetical protein
MAVVADPRPRPRLRIALAVLGCLFTLGFIGVGALMLLDLAARHSFRTAAGYADVRTLIVHTGAGDVSLASAPAGARLTVRASETESLFKPKVRSRLSADGRTLALTAGCSEELGCSVHLDVSVPPDVAVQVSAGFGDIDVTGLTSTSSIQLGTTAGDIHATGLSAPDIRVSTGVGGLNAVLVAPARRLTATTVAGGLRLTVPNVSYAVQASSGVGHVSDAGVRSNPASPRSIVARSSIGNVTITARR